MAPSVCQNSPKLPPHNNTQSGVHSGGGGGGGGGSGGGAVTNGVIGGGVVGGAAGGSSSITQRSNCGSSSINGSMASYKMSTTSETSWSQTVFSKVSWKNREHIKFNKQKKKKFLYRELNPGILTTRQYGTIVQSLE